MNNKQKILYCNIGHMENYNGINNEDSKPSGGGSYNGDNIGYEVNNFTIHKINNGEFCYGYVRPKSGTIDISKNFHCSKDADYVDDVLVVFLEKKKIIVGFYEHATVYREFQEENTKYDNLEKMFNGERVYYCYNLKTKAENAILIHTDKATGKRPYEIPR